MPPSVLRLAYIFEFLLALLAVFTLWSQVGGQYHLDLMPWYDKLGLGVGLALVTVLGTASAVSGQRAWNGRTIAFLLIALILMGAMGAITYYYHLQEPDDDEDDDTPNKAALIYRAPPLPPL